MLSKITDYIRKHPVGFTLSLIGGFIVFLFLYISFVTIAYGGKVKVTISVVPKDAVVTIDGKETGSRTLYLEPKKYAFSASKDGYEKYSKDIYLEENQSESTVALSLVAITDSAQTEAERNQNDYLKNEGIAGKQKRDDGLRFREKNPIVNKLPYKTLLYTLGYRADPSDPSGMSIIIEIDTAEGMRADVAKQIARWGYDPTEMNIRFRNYENPFN